MWSKTCFSNVLFVIGLKCTNLEIVGLNMRSDWKQHCVKWGCHDGSELPKLQVRQWNQIQIQFGWQMNVLEGLSDAYANHQFMTDRNWKNFGKGSVRQSAEKLEKIKLTSTFFANALCICIPAPSITWPQWNVWGSLLFFIQFCFHFSTQHT